jgi:hypothetical protein
MCPTEHDLEGLKGRHRILMASPAIKMAYTRLFPSLYRFIA